MAIMGISLFFISFHPSLFFYLPKLSIQRDIRAKSKILINRRGAFGLRRGGLGLGLCCFGFRIGGFCFRLGGLLLTGDGGLKTYADIAPGIKLLRGHTYGRGSITARRGGGIGAFGIIIRTGDNHCQHKCQYQKRCNKFFHNYPFLKTLYMLSIPHKDIFVKMFFKTKQNNCFAEKRRSKAQKWLEIKGIKWYKYNVWICAVAQIS